MSEHALCRLCGLPTKPYYDFCEACVQATRRQVELKQAALTMPTPNEPAAQTTTPERSGFNYLVSYGGGIGPDVWDREREVSGVDIFDALTQAQIFTEEGGWVFKIEQNDYPPTSREVLETRLATETKRADDLEAALGKAWITRDAMERERDEAVKRVDDAEARLDRFAHCINPCPQGHGLQVECYGCQRDAAIAERDALQAKLEDAEARIAHSQADYATLRENSARDIDALTAAQERVKRLREALNEIEELPSWDTGAAEQTKYRAIARAALTQPAKPTQA